MVRMVLTQTLQEQRALCSSACRQQQSLQHPAAAAELLVHLVMDLLHAAVRVALRQIPTAYRQRRQQLLHLQVPATQQQGMHQQAAQVLCCRLGLTPQPVCPVGDKVSAPSAAPAPAGTAGVGADTVAATAAGLAGAAANAVATVAAASAAAAAGKEGMSSSRQVMYSNRTVVLTFTDPTLPYQLSKLVKVSQKSWGKCMDRTLLEPAAICIQALMLCHIVPATAPTAGSLPVRPCRALLSSLLALWLCRTPATCTC